MDRGNLQDYWVLKQRLHCADESSTRAPFLDYHASLRGGGATLLQPREGTSPIAFFLCRFLFVSRDDVFVCRQALLHHRVSGGQREPSDNRGTDLPDGFNVFQPDNRCLDERLPGSAGQVPLPDPRPGVSRSGEPPLPHRGPSPARRLPPTAPALLRDATPRSAQLLPLGPKEQVLWTQISR